MAIPGVCVKNMQHSKILCFHFSQETVQQLYFYFVSAVCSDVRQMHTAPDQSNIQSSKRYSDTVIVSCLRKHELHNICLYYDILFAVV